MATKVDPSHLRDAQDAVTVNYILAGWLPDHGDGLVPEGLWTLEITEHALARHHLARHEMIYKLISMIKPAGTIIWVAIRLKNNRNDPAPSGI